MLRVTTFTVAPVVPGPEEEPSQAPVDNRRLPTRHVGERERSLLLRQSTHRCQMQRVTGQTVMRPLPTARPDSRLQHLAVAQIAAAVEPATDLGASVVLTDAAGVVLRVWEGAPEVGARLDAVGIRPGSVVTEAEIGTSSLSALISRSHMEVRGTEHLHPALTALTSAGGVVVQPGTRRILGAGPFLMLWLDSLIRDIEDLAHEDATRSDTVLMDRFLHELRDSRHAVVALSDKTIITNAAAARLVGVEEQSVLWQHARDVMRRNSQVDSIVEVGRGLSLKVTCEPVRDGADIVGAVMRAGLDSDVSEADRFQIRIHAARRRAGLR